MLHFFRSSFAIEKSEKSGKETIKERKKAKEGGKRGQARTCASIHSWETGGKTEESI